MRSHSCLLAATVGTICCLVAPAGRALAGKRADSARTAVAHVAHDALRMQLAMCLMESSDEKIASVAPVTFTLGGTLIRTESGELRPESIQVEGAPEFLQEGCSLGPAEAEATFWFSTWAAESARMCQSLPRRFVPQTLEVEATVEITEVVGCQLLHNTPLASVSYDPLDLPGRWSEGLSDFWYTKGSCTADLRGCQALLAEGCSPELQERTCQADAERLDGLADEDVVLALQALPREAVAPAACPDLRAALKGTARDQLVAAAVDGDVERAQALATALIFDDPAMTEFGIGSNRPGGEIKRRKRLGDIAPCLAGNWDGIAHYYAPMEAYWDTASQTRVRRDPHARFVNMGGKLENRDPGGMGAFGECMTERGQEGPLKSLEGQKVPADVLDRMAVVYIAGLARDAPSGPLAAYLELQGLWGWPYAGLVGSDARKAIRPILDAIEVLPGFAEQRTAHEERLAAEQAAREREARTEEAREVWDQRGDWMDEFGHRNVDDFVMDLASCGVLRKRVGGGCPAEVYAKGVRLFRKHNLRPAEQIGGTEAVEALAAGACSGSFFSTSLSYQGVTVNFDRQTCVNEVLSWGE